MRSIFQTLLGYIFFPMHAVFFKILFFFKIIIINLFQFFFTCINSIFHQIIYSSYISEDLFPNNNTLYIESYKSTNDNSGYKSFQRA